MARICLISSIHPWVNPRLVKEADSLAARGHDVVVLTKRVDPWADGRDGRLLADKRWRAERVNLIRRDPAGRRAWAVSALRSAVAARAHRLTGALPLAEEGYYRGFSRVLAAAVATRADFFVAHTQGALPIAARAAAALGVKYGFDCEDLLADEAADGLTHPWRRRAIRQIERAYLPGAAYVTATSQAMATYLRAAYAIASPHVVYNVFPLHEVAGLEPPRDRPRRDTVELVWMSATVGPGRGLEDAIRSLAHLPAAVRLTVFGRMLPAYSIPFDDLVRACGVGARVTLRPIVEPHEVMATIAQFDIGLTLDLNDCLNRSLTICNKLFLYLQAGLVVGATATPGQREIIDAEPGIGFVYPPGEASALATRLLPYVTNRDIRLAAQQAAWVAGQRQYNWDRDAEIFYAALVATWSASRAQVGAA